MNKLNELLSHITAPHVYIQTHNFPDPDAIASAFGMQKLLETQGISSSICYLGTIERHSTVKMIDALGIKISKVPDLNLISSKDEIILVDSQKGNANVRDIPGNKIICIDHHPTFEEASYAFKDIRPEVGACASIIANYFIGHGIPLDSMTATALLYGVKIDTANLTRGVSQLDLDMFYNLYKQTNQDILRYLDQSSIQFDDLAAFSNAINSIQVFDNISFANTGLNCPEALIATISDFMLSLSEVEFSIVYSMKSEGIKLSIRSEFPKYDAGQVCYKALDGIGSGGGHDTMAGGFVPFTGNVRYDSGLITTIQNRFLNILTA